MSQTTSDAVGAVVSDDIRHLTPEEMPAVLRFSEMLRKFVDRVGRFGAWFAMPMILITVFDLFIRKFKIIRIHGDTIQIWLRDNVSPFFDSTLLQELEWHSHTVLFTLVLGFGYIWNTHVRVDLVRETLKFRKKAWLELIGLTIFLVPFTCIIIYYSAVYAIDSWAFNRFEGCAWWQCGEISMSLVGMSHRWIIKAVLTFGLVVALLAGLAVWLQTAMVLFGPKNIRFPLMTLDWPEATGGAVEGKERLELKNLDDQLELRAAAVQAELAEQSTNAESSSRE